MARAQQRLQGGRVSGPGRQPGDLGLLAGFLTAPLRPGTGGEEESSVVAGLSPRRATWASFSRDLTASVASERGTQCSWPIKLPHFGVWKNPLQRESDARRGGRG